MVAEPYTEPSGAQNNYTLHKDTQHNGCILTQHNNKGRVALLYCNADCRYAHCRFAECGYTDYRYAGCHSAECRVALHTAGGTINRVLEYFFRFKFFFRT